MSRTPAAGVFGRDEDLGAVQALLSAMQEGPTGLVLTGAPGIGKTTLWQRGVDDAQQRFGRVLLHRSAEAEASLSFTGLSDLVGPVLDRVRTSLAPLRRQALEVALLLAEPGERPPDPRAIGLALLDTLHALAAEGPVLVALDDVQWLDASSAAVMQIALRRLRGAPVGVLATLRSQPGPVNPFALDRALPQERVEQRSLGALSLDALDQLLRERIDLELTPAELASVQETSGGNPYFALELGRELVRTKSRPVPGRSLRVPESLQQLLGDRLDRSPPEAMDVLLPAAALAQPTVELVAAVHGEPARALEALDAAAREGLIELEGPRIRFAHPLLASVCYDRAPFGRRRATHAALAEVVADVEERARHLARAADAADATVASALESAADHAAKRGATQAAAELSELASELTPREDPQGRRRRLLGAAGYHRLAGHGERAVALLEPLLAEVPSGVERADILFALVVTMRGQTLEKIELIEEALANAVDDDVRCTQFLAHRMGTHLWNADVPAALADGKAALEKAERLADPALLAITIGRIGTVEAYAAQITPGLLERGAEVEERHGLVLEYTNSPLYALTRLRMRLGEIDRPRAVLESLEANATARGDEHSRVMLQWTLAMLEWSAGSWEQALGHCEAAHRLTKETQYPHALAWVGRVKALVEADLGLVDEARASVAEGLAFTRSTGNEFSTIHCLSALGRLELAIGDLEAAAAHLRPLPGRLLAGGIDDPTVPVWADTIETLAALGDIAPARAYLEHYESSSLRLDSPWARAAAGRCRGLLATAEGDLDAAFKAFERVVADLETLDSPFELGRTLLGLGSARRRARDKRLARDALAQALAIFEGLGARLWARKAEGELRRISGRRRTAAAELTEMESRVAVMAADGHSNKEIAAALFLSVHTVSAHLSHVYRKLGIRSRVQLRVRLDASETARTAN
jgi:DNA-binding CsgD family transcriptional regulator